MPRKGKNNDKAHPPIHPTKVATELNGEDKSVYEFVTKRFLACCSDDALGQKTTVEIEIHGERFTAGGSFIHMEAALHVVGLQVLARNYLEVYTYEKWTDAPMPIFQVGELFEPTSLQMTEGKTTAPQLLTEADLITTMDKNGIGKGRDGFFGGFTV